MTTFIDSYVAFRTTTQVLTTGFSGVALTIQPCYHSLFSVKTERKSELPQEGFKKEMSRKLKDALKDEENIATLVGFGSLDEILICTVKPQVNQLVRLRKPAFLSEGTVPYLDWGMAVTPQHRDRSYPCAVIVWGNLLQVLVLSNELQVNQGTEIPKLECDGFYIGDCSTIDKVFFLSESILFVLTDKQQVKIVYTQNLTPGSFDEQSFETDFLNGSSLLDRDVQFYMRLRETYAGSVSQYSEKDSGYTLTDDEIVTFDNMPPAANKSHAALPLNNFNTAICTN